LKPSLAGGEKEKKGGKGVRRFISLGRKKGGRGVKKEEKK